MSVNQLVEMGAAKGTNYDHVVIESSGISEPKSVRSVFQDAESYGMRLLDEVLLFCFVFSSKLFLFASLSVFGFFFSVLSFESNFRLVCFFLVEFVFYLFY